MTKKYIFSLAREEILKLIPYKSARDDFSSNQKKMIMMDANENPFENGLKVEMRFWVEDINFDPEEVYKGHPNPTKI